MSAQSRTMPFDPDRAAAGSILDLAAGLWREAVKAVAAWDSIRYRLRDIDGWSHHAEVAYCEERRTSRP